MSAGGSERPVGVLCTRRRKGDRLRDPAFACTLRASLPAHSSSGVEVVLLGASVGLPWTCHSEHRGASFSSKEPRAPPVPAPAQALCHGKLAPAPAPVSWCSDGLRCEWDRRLWGNEDGGHVLAKTLWSCGRLFSLFCFSAKDSSFLLSLALPVLGAGCRATTTCGTSWPLRGRFQPMTPWSLSTRRSASLGEAGAPAERGKVVQGEGEGEKERRTGKKRSQGEGRRRRGRMSWQVWLLTAQPRLARRARRVRQVAGSSRRPSTWHSLATGPRT